MTQLLDEARKCLALSNLHFHNGEAADAHKALVTSLRLTFHILETLIGVEEEEDGGRAATVAAGKFDPPRGPIPADFQTSSERLHKELIRLEEIGVRGSHEPQVVDP